MIRSSDVYQHQQGWSVHTLVLFGCVFMGFLVQIPLLSGQSRMVSTLRSASKILRVAWNCGISVRAIYISHCPTELISPLKDQQAESSSPLTGPEPSITTASIIRTPVPLRTPNQLRHPRPQPAKPYDEPPPLLLAGSSPSSLHLVLEALLADHVESGRWRRFGRGVRGPATVWERCNHLQGIREGLGAYVLATLGVPSSIRMARV
jgi:hypothetical protein